MFSHYVWPKSFKFITAVGKAYICYLMVCFASWIMPEVTTKCVPFTSLVSVCPFYAHCFSFFVLC